MRTKRTVTSAAAAAVLLMPATAFAAQEDGAAASHAVQACADLGLEGHAYGVGDSAYADADTLDDLEEQGHTPWAKVPPTRNRDGLFNKDEFDIDLDKQEVTCPAGNTVPILAHPTGGGTASFGDLCASCPLRDMCTTSATGRTAARRRERGVCGPVASFAIVSSPRASRSLGASRAGAASSARR